MMKKMRAYTLVNGISQVYTLEASIQNIVNFIMSQPIDVETIAITDMKNNIVCTTMGQFLDRVPSQSLVPHLQKQLIPLQIGEKMPDIQLPEAMPTNICLDHHNMRNRPCADELSTYLFERETELIFKSPHGFTNKLHLYVNTYENNNSLYVGLYDSKEKEHFMDITSNTAESTGLKQYCAAVKNYGENEGMEEFIREYKLGAPTGQMIRSGFVSMPVYIFDVSRLAELSLNGIWNYEATLKDGIPNPNPMPNPIAEMLNNGDVTVITLDANKKTEE